MFDLSSYSFSPYALPLLIVGGLSAAHGLATLVRERASPVSLAFLAMTVATSLWLLSFGAVYSTQDPSVAFAWVRVEHVGVVLIPPAVFLFTAALTGRLRSIWPLVLCAFGLSAVFYTLIVSTGWFIVGLHKYYWGYYPIYGWAILPFVALFAVLLTTSLRLYQTSIGHATSAAQRSRLRAIWLALLIANLASIDYLPAFHVPVYPFGYAFIGAFMLIAPVAIWRYRLVDITPAFAANEIVETMADALLVLDGDGIIRSANSAAAKMLGSPKEKVVGITAEALDQMWFAGALGGLADPEAVHRAEVTYRRPDGESGTALISASVVRNGAGERQATICIVHDITERKRAEVALRESEGLYRTLVETSPDAVLVAEAAGRILMANRRAAELVGYAGADELRGRNAMEFVAEQDRLRLGESFREASGAVIIRDVEYALLKRDGSQLPAELSVSRVPGAESGTIMAVARDVSDRKRAEETIRYLAFHDSLTGIANRSVMVDHLSKALAQARRDSSMVALLFMDLDNFKRINDTVGHAAGDETLRRIAKELLLLVREGDTLARMGGDEFVVLLARVSGRIDAISVAERILSRVREPRQSDIQAKLTASIGIAIFPTDGEDAESLLLRADSAMYVAKSAGGDRYEFARQAPAAAHSA